MNTKKIDAWRKSQNMTFNELGKLLGLSRQGCHSMCHKGIRGAANLYRFIEMSNGELSIEDFIPEHELKILKEGGLYASDPFDI